MSVVTTGGRFFGLFFFRHSVMYLWCMFCISRWLEYFCWRICTWLCLNSLYIYVYVILLLYNEIINFSEERKKKHWSFLTAWPLQINVEKPTKAEVIHTYIQSIYNLPLPTRSILCTPLPSCVGGYMVWMVIYGEDDSEKRGSRWSITLEWNMVRKYVM